MTVFYTSDTHFRHRLVAGKRGFSSPEEHDEVITETWNKTVRSSDIVFLLGDFAMNWKGAGDRLAALNGTIHLIAGNHDIVSPVHRDAHKYQAAWIGDGKFASVQAFARRRVAGLELLMSHFPYEGEGDRDIPERYTQFRLRDEGGWLLHGHTHGTERLHGHQYHAGLDAHDLHLVYEDEIISQIRQSA